MALSLASPLRTLAPRALPAARPRLSAPRRAAARPPRAVSEPERPAGSGAGPAQLQSLRDSCSSLLARYDFLSAGFGALLVTSFCVARGQDPWTALGVTAASTVVALVVNDMFFTDESR